MPASSPPQERSESRQPSLARSSTIEPPSSPLTHDQLPAWADAFASYSTSSESVPARAPFGRSRQKAIIGVTAHNAFGGFIRLASVQMQNW